MRLTVTTAMRPAGSVVGNLWPHLELAAQFAVRKGSYRSHTDAALARVHPDLKPFIQAFYRGIGPPLLEVVPPCGLAFIQRSLEVYLKGCL